MIGHKLLSLTVFGIMLKHVGKMVKKTKKNTFYINTCQK